MFSYSFDFHPFQNPNGSALAFVDLIIDSTLKVKGFKIMKNQSSGELWVAPPQEKSNKMDDDGKPIYFPRVSWVDPKADDADRRTKAQEELYTEMINAWESSNTSQARRGAAQQHATRNNQGKLWKRNAN